MKIKTNQGWQSANGTSLRGYFTATFNEVVAAFGQPEDWGAGDKSTVEWIIEFEDGTIATIYDWKSESPMYTPDVPYDWHVGGHHEQGMKSLEHILDILGK